MTTGFDGRGDRIALVVWDGLPAMPAAPTPTSIGYIHTLPRYFAPFYLQGCLGRRYTCHYLSQAFVIK